MAVRAASSSSAMAVSDLEPALLRGRSGNGYRLKNRLQAIERDTNVV